MLEGTIGTDIAYTSYSQADTSWHGYCYARAPAPYIYALEINCKYIEIVVDTMRPSYIMNPSRQGRSERNT